MSNAIWYRTPNIRRHPIEVRATGAQHIICCADKKHAQALVMQNKAFEKLTRMMYRF
jgi:hypothetical protein